MLATNDAPVETNFKEKIRCGEVYRNLNGNQMFQKFYYRCLECSMDFESGPDFEEHVIVHLLQDDGANGANGQSENVIDISSDNEEDDGEDNAFLYAVEVTSMGGDEVSECDLPSPIKKMLSQESINLDDENVLLSSNTDDDDHEHNVDDEDGDDDDDDDSNDQDITFPCKGLRNQALHQYSDPDNCCQLCPAYFTTKFDLNQHRLVHAMSGTAECPHCYEVFSSPFKLHQHIRTRRLKAPIQRKNGAKKKRSESQSETSANVETDDDRSSGGQMKMANTNAKQQSVTTLNDGNNCFKENPTANLCPNKTDGHGQTAMETYFNASETGSIQMNPISATTATTTSTQPNATNN